MARSCSLYSPGEPSFLCPDDISPSPKKALHHCIHLSNAVLGWGPGRILLAIPVQVLLVTWTYPTSPETLWSWWRTGTDMSG